LIQSTLGQFLLSDSNFRNLDFRLALEIKTRSQNGTFDDLNAIDVLWSWLMIEIKCDTGDNIFVDADSLRGAMLRWMNLHRAQLDAADLSEADLAGADLRSASLEGIIACGANFERTNLVAVIAKEANFSNARMSGCRFISGDFQDSVFVNADLTGADLDYANLCGCDFRGAKLVGASFDQCTVDETTIWPDGFTPPGA
jgi:uncharacterized protein YjbI with pentapeptide repeats